jgi:hypothetical protein
MKRTVTGSIAKTAGPVVRGIVLIAAFLSAAAPVRAGASSIIRHKPNTLLAAELGKRPLSLA